MIRTRCYFKCVAVHKVEKPADQVARYIDSVISGAVNVGVRERQAVERHLYDLENAHARGLSFDENKAAAAVAWFPLSLHHIEGEWADDPVTLTDNQAFIVWCLFGWRRADGTRRYRHAYISCARKWGKSTLSAGFGLMLLTFDDPLEKGAQIYCAATKEDQAKIVWKIARAMADHPRAKFLKGQVNTLAKSIVTKHNALQANSFFVPIGSDSRTSDGFNLHGGVCDEVHEWGQRHELLWGKLNTASGARTQPLLITITTAGSDRSKLWIELDKLCCTVLDGYQDEQPPGDNRFVFIARLDEARPCQCGGLNPDCPECQVDGKATGEIPADDPFDPANWRKANPNYPITPKHDYLAEQAADAQLSAIGKHNFLRYHCNIRVSALDQAITDAVWAAARKRHDDWDDADAICGAWDMGGQDDLAALGFCARFETGEFETTKDGKQGKPIYRYEVDAKGFLSTDAERDITKEPWPTWIDQKLLVADPFEIEAMKNEVIWEASNNYIKSWAYDPANSRDFAQSLTPEGIETVKFHQNASMWTEPLTAFLKDLKRGRITHDGNGLLAWAATNMIVVRMSRRASIQCMPDKSASTEKIDPIVAVIMAYRLATIAPPRSRGRLFVS